MDFSYAGANGGIDYINLILITGIFYITLKLGTLGINRIIKLNKSISERKANTLKQVILNVFRTVVTFLFVVAILQELGFDPTSFIALFSVFTLAIGLAAQDIIKDFIEGFLLLLEDQFAIGDTIVINNQVKGEVERLGLRTTSIRTIDGELFIVPNGYIETIKTFSKDFSRANITVGVDYSTDIDNCLKVLEDEMTIAQNEVDDIISKPDVQGVVELADSSVNIRILIDCKIDKKWDVEREMLRRIKNRFDKEGIVIPFPQRVVHNVAND